MQDAQLTALAAELVDRFEEAVLERYSSMQFAKGKVTVDSAKDERYQEKRTTVISLIVDAMKSE